MTHYDAVIIGFGKAGKTLAGFLARKGQTVAMVEQSAQMYGGTCINIGCIPSKTLVHDAGDGKPFEQAMRRKQQVVSLLREKNFQMLDALDNVTLITGQARFIDAHTLRITGEQGDRQISGRQIFINTGARHNLPPVPGLRETPHVYDSSGLLQLSRRPSRLIILGAGYIGVEFASMFSQFGSKVTMLEAMDLFLPAEDRDIAGQVAAVLRDNGVTLHTGAVAEKISASGDEVVLQSRVGEIRADALLVAAGRVPNSAGLALENAGVQVNERGAIVVDQHLRTSQPHIWAIGDVNGGPQFTYISLDDFRIVRDQLYGTGKRHTGDRQSVPYSVYMTPTLSRVGITEQQAKERGEPVKVVSLPVAAIPRARTLNDTRGMLKAIVHQHSGKILGAALLCRDSHEMINLIKTVMDSGLSYQVLRDQIYTHPTMSEAFNDLFALVD